MPKKHVVRLIVLYLIIMSGILSGFGCQGPISSSLLSARRVILVRHAEKAGEQGDVPLTEKGENRAQLLARMLSEARVGAIYATQYQRTQMTAEPLSEQTGVPVTTLSIEDAAEHARRLAAKIKSGDHAGQTVVYIGHNNTVPLILAELGIKGFKGLAQYEQMFIVVLYEDRPAEMIIIHYDL